MLKKIKTWYQLQILFNSSLQYKSQGYPFKWYVDVIFKRGFYTLNKKPYLFDNLKNEKDT